MMRSAAPGSVTDVKHVNQSRDLRRQSVCKTVWALEVSPIPLHAQHNFLISRFLMAPVN
jgi:hypothetical protein